MPGDLTFDPLSSLPPVQAPPAPASKPSSAGPPPVGAALTAVVPQMPSIALDADKGVVVIDFRNDAGAVVNSIPTAQQLAAYAASVPPVPTQSTAASRDATAAPPGGSSGAPRPAKPAPRR